MNSGVIWVTGLSGAGKTTIAARLRLRFLAEGRSVVLLDGDQVREAVGDENCGHDPASRLVNAYRICRLAGMLVRQGLTVIVATMSLFHEIHDWNRDNLPGYFEVFLDVSPEVLRQRDPKGLYRRSDLGQETNIGGVHVRIEAPLHAHLRLSNNGSEEEIGKIVETIYREFNAAGESAS